RYAASVRLSLKCCARETLRRLGLATGAADHANVPAFRIDEDDRGITNGGFVGIGGRHDVLAGTNIGQQLARLFRVGEIPVGAQLAEGLERRVEMALGDRSRAAACDQTAK